MNNILIKTNDCSHEELAELQEYLLSWRWDWLNLTKNNGSNIEAIISSIEDLGKEITSIADSLNEKNIKGFEIKTKIAEILAVARKLNMDDLIGYTLKEDSISGIKIHDKIMIEQLFEYEIRDREDYIENLITWIAESKSNDKVLMKEDLKMLMGLTDDYVFSSISTNNYIYQGHPEFNKTCEDLLTLNNEIYEEEQR